MRSNEERIAEVKRRIAEKEYKKKTAERMGCSSLLRGRMSCGDRRCFPFHA